jgi:hypothetical protein
MSQPHIDETLMQRLARVAAAYEMPVGKMLAHILTISLEELEGKQDDYTLCLPVSRTHGPVQREAMRQCSDPVYSDESVDGEELPF